MSNVRRKQSTEGHVRLKLYMPFRFGNKALQLCGRAFSAVRPELCAPFRWWPLALATRFPLFLLMPVVRRSEILGLLTDLPSLIRVELLTSLAIMFRVLYTLLRAELNHEHSSGSV